MSHCLNEWVIDSSDLFKWLIHSVNEASDCLYERFTESLTHLIRSKTLNHSVTKHCCVLLGDVRLFCCEQRSIMCLKCKSVNNNYLFIELLLYKISVTFAIVLIFGKTSLLGFFLIDVLITLLVEQLLVHLPLHRIHCPGQVLI